MHRNIRNFCDNLHIHFPNWTIRAWEIIKERQLIKQFYIKDTHDSNTPTAKQVICMFDDRWNSGGLSDRLHGMVSGYYIASKAGAEYKINHFTPFDLSLFLQPSECDWIISQHDISYVLPISRPILARAYRSPSEKARKQYYIKEIKKNNNYQTHLYINANFLSDIEFTNCFHKLFKPTPLLQSSIDTHLQNIGTQYVNVTFRFQQLLGDFIEGNFPILSSGAQEKLIAECLGVLQEIHYRHDKLKILVTSDSSTFLNRVNQLAYTYTIPGQVIHMAYSDDKSIAPHLKSFLDFFMIANASKIYLAQIGDMYNSSFPLLASRIHQRPFEIIQSTINQQ